MLKFNTVEALLRRYYAHDAMDYLLEATYALAHTNVPSLSLNRHMSSIPTQNQSYSLQRFSSWEAAPRNLFRERSTPDSGSTAKPHHDDWHAACLSVTWAKCRSDDVSSDKRPSCTGTRVNCPRGVPLSLRGVRA